MSITLSPQIEGRTRDWIDTGRYTDADAVIDKALQALEEQEHARFLRLRDLVQAGFASGNRVAFTDELMDEIERRAEERFQRGDQPSPDVCP